ncbi:MAG: M48 family metallopeptidase [Saprospiraceae bacterium]|nr:M48 family metallopeptidase [Saprospiraceae bacterium]
MDPKILSGLVPSMYCHPLEVKALENLRKTKGLPILVNKFHEIGLEQNMQLQYQSNCILVNSRNFNHLVYLLEKAKDILQVDQDIQLCLQRTDKLEGLSIGIEKPMIILSTQAVDLLSHQEILFLLGREVGHLAHQHTLYKEIGLIFPDLMEAFSVVTLGISSLVSAGLKYALYNWDRMSELTADRGGLLACQDPDAAFSLFAKLAGWPERQWSSINLEEFKRQIKSFNAGSQKTFDKVISYMLGSNSWSIARAKELLGWIDDGHYQALLASISIASK